MRARYAGKCAECWQRFSAGSEIRFDETAPRGRKTRHVDCDAAADAAEPLYGEYGSEKWNNRPTHEIRTASGTFYQRAGGRCEDAPCCGCCGRWD